MRLVEAVLVGAGGAALGALTFGLFEVAIVGGVIGGLNGVISGALGIYDWRSPRGALAMLIDSSWGLPLIAGSMFLHAANLITRSADYRTHLSSRSGYHVYGAGIYAKKGFVWTVGNVMSNTRPHDARRLQMLERHEALHVWQHRAFGPFYPFLYLSWMVAGGIIGTAIWLKRRGSLATTIETIAYYDNPFETWAYIRDERWPHPAADRTLSWGGRRQTRD
jgi:hypothetical protein